MKVRVEDSLKLFYQVIKQRKCTHHSVSIFNSNNPSNFLGERSNQYPLEEEDLGLKHSNLKKSVTDPSGLQESSTGSRYLERSVMENEYLTQGKLSLPTTCAHQSVSIFNYNNPSNFLGERSSQSPLEEEESGLKHSNLKQSVTDPSGLQESSTGSPHTSNIRHLERRSVMENQYLTHGTLSLPTTWSQEQLVTMGRRAPRSNQSPSEVEDQGALSHSWRKSPRHFMRLKSSQPAAEEEDPGAANHQRRRRNQEQPDILGGRGCNTHHSVSIFNSNNPSNFLGERSNQYPLEEEDLAVSQSLMPGKFASAHHSVSIFNSNNPSNFLGERSSQSPVEEENAGLKHSNLKQSVTDPSGLQESSRGSPHTSYVRHLERRSVMENQYLTNGKLSLPNTRSETQQSETECD
ncbi:hypothetical protein STEG23_027071 [Scotinomys teguina]